MPTPELRTVRDVLAWSYANLASTHAALKDGRIKHVRTDWMIRAKLFRGLRDGTMRMGGLFDDERLALIAFPRCAYCDAAGPLAIDHLIPRAAGGTDDSHNLVRACQTCNSSKGRRDFLAWHISQKRFPPVLLLRRYLKIVAAYCERASIMDQAFDHPEVATLPFDIRLLPLDFPPLADLRL